VEKACELQDLALAELREFSPAFGDDIHQHLTVAAVLACHDVAGGTAPQQVQSAIQAARQTIARMQEAHVTHA
jgi:argininosuccinate lyase